MTTRVDTTTLPRDILLEVDEETLAASGGQFQSPYISSVGIDEVLITLLGEDPGLVAVIRETTTDNWDTCWTEVPISEWPSNGFMPIRYCGYLDLELTSACFMLWVANTGTGSTFFNASIRVKK